ncbi:hypothetical protein GCM10007989_14000 [Devosia pacifica]|uniref:Uncharacterized protein n=1 Tax=Devosia pacifica TaxID=1335967 RepID=A0A918VS41_9HYPH|nr:hypothetical protein [Devosia pacifica]GHA19606.1 hypothetical protein GCM10007989_14000 [Devosia pacifica]
MDSKLGTARSVFLCALVAICIIAFPSDQAVGSPIDEDCNAEIDAVDRAVSLTFEHFSGFSSFSVVDFEAMLLEELPLQLSIECLPMLPQVSETGQFEQTSSGHVFHAEGRVKIGFSIDRQGILTHHYAKVK